MGLVKVVVNAYWAPNPGTVLDTGAAPPSVNVFIGRDTGQMFHMELTWLL